MTSRTPHLRVAHFLLPKSETNAAECEDAVGINHANWRYAVADGATEAFDARGWATRLAHTWAACPRSAVLRPEDFREWAQAEGAAWHSEWAEQSLPWYAEEKRRAGSFAAFAGIEFRMDDERLGWRAVALGDACLVHRRGGATLAALPLSDYRRFNATPLLVPSRVGAHRTAFEATISEEGWATPNDVFLLFSDALAAWYLKHAEARDRVIADFDCLLTGSPNGNTKETAQTDRLVEFCERARGGGDLRDDDLALVCIVVREV